jgi:DNA modification methylase
VAVLSHAWYNWAHEPCWVARRPGLTGLWLGTRDQGTIWRVPSPRMITSGAGVERLPHPAQKPVELYEAPIRNHLELGEWLYDPFVGSGTAIIAAERLGRRCAAVEIEPRYVQLVIDRWERYTGRKAELAHRSEDA